MRAHLVFLLGACLVATPALAAKHSPSKGRAPKKPSIALVEPPPVEGVSAKAIKWSAYFASEELKGEGFRLIPAKQVAQAHAKKKMKVPACNDEPQCLAGIGKVTAADYVANVTVRPAGKQLGVKLTIVDTADAKIVSNIFSLVFNDEPKTLRQAIKKQIPRATAALKKHVAEKAASAPAVADAGGDQPPVVSLTKPATEEPPVVSLTKPKTEEPAVVSLTKPKAEEPAVVSLTKPKAEEPAVVSLTKPKAEEPAVVALTKPKAEEPAVVALTKQKTEGPAVAALTKPKAEGPAVAAATKPKAEGPVAAPATKPKAEGPAAAPAAKPKAEEPAVAALTKPADKKPSAEPAAVAVTKPAEEPAVVAVAKPVEDLTQGVVAQVTPPAEPEVKPEEPAVKVIEAAGDVPKALTKVTPEVDDKVAGGPAVADEPFRVPTFIPYTLIGVGAVATGLGVGLFGQEARTATADYQAGRDPSAAREIAKSKALYTDISAGAGIALMATGGILMLFTGDDKPASTDAPSVSVSPTANGAAVTGSF
ncbi:MAG: hypothetical protein ACOX6T_09335 [Myxococcales bacterium]|jgi:hypothetical protein